MCGCGCDGVDITSAVSDNGSISVSSFSNFCLVVLIINLLIIPFLSLLERAVLNNTLRRRGGGSTNSLI